MSSSSRMWLVNKTLEDFLDGFLQIFFTDFMDDKDFKNSEEKILCLFRTIRARNCCYRGVFRIMFFHKPQDRNAFPSENDISRGVTGKIHPYHHYFGGISFH